jgi:hypothetical protein
MRFYIFLSCLRCAMRALILNRSAG